MTIKRITRDAILLALLCVTGMFSIPLGDNIKVSLQILTLFIVFGLCSELFDRILIPTLYLLIGLIAPIYAGFMSGITPTFGYVISFTISAIPFHFIYKYLKINFYVKYVVACLISLLIIYFGGTLFMCLYLHMELGPTLLMAVVPYIPFDVIKIVIATLVVKLLPRTISNIQEDK